ncbi:hypothetical protein H8356DRAFT_1430277 [Neocallimastix lanati (nom. inval.)]|nr:hypothetical protein H8356DRAFT_1430277 [Neocallimastix sp. JGI-2020a]
MDTINDKNELFIDIIKRNDIIKSKSSPDVSLFFMKFVGEKRKNIIDIIKKNDPKILNFYIMENNIKLKEYNTRDFDILLSSIDNNVSLEMINFIIEECQYQNFNYTICNPKINVLKRTPLFSAIFSNNYHIADLLIKHNADINYSDGDILYYLFYLDLLEIKNLKYLLNSGINTELIITFISFLIKNYPYTDQPITEFINTIFTHYIYSNEFVLKFLLSYKNKEALTTKEIQEKIDKVTTLIIKDKFYEEAVYYEFNEALEILLKNDPRNKTEILIKIEKYKSQGSYHDDEEEDEDEENNENNVEINNN